MRNPRYAVAWNPWQFSLRAILCLTVLASIVAAVYGNRLRREQRLRELIEDFFAAKHDGRSADAKQIAELAVRDFPGRIEAIDMLESSRLISHLAEVNSSEDEAKWAPVESDAVRQDNYSPAHTGGDEPAVLHSAMAVE